MHEYRTRRCAEVLAGIINILINITIKLTKNIKLHSSKMGIAETDKRPSRDIHDVRPQTAKHRSILKRRPIQLTSNYLHGTFCTNLQRQWNRRRMRRLFSIDRTEAMGLKSRWELVWELCLYIIYFVVPMLAILGFNCGLNFYENSEMFSSLVQRYTSQYYATVHNKVNYCDRTMPLYDMFEHINGAVINQATALRELKEALAKQNFQSIALVGTTGLGKTLTVRNLLEIYPWPENTQTIAWNDYELNDNESRYKVVLKALRNLSHCGRNLIVIDNMAMCDMEYVPAINNMVMSFGDVATGPHNEVKKQVAIIFVFNANSMLPKEHYIKQLDSLKKIEATSIIEYRGFEREDVEMCVRHEQYQLGLKLDQRHYEDIINSTNVKITGCKTVRAKVLLHGEPVKTIEELFSTEEDEF